MATAKQVEANRSNALRSKGPTSEQGKKSASGNATRHGLTSETPVLLPGEDEAAFEDLRRNLRKEYRPDGALQQQLVDRIAELMWRLRRASRIEAGVLQFSYFEQTRVRAEQRRQLASDRRCADLSSHLTEDEEKRPWEEMAQALEQRDSKTSFLGQAFVEDATNRNALGKLSRYETALWNNFSRAEKRLLAMQENRVEPLHAADVHDLKQSRSSADTDASGELPENAAGATEILN